MDEYTLILSFSLLHSVQGPAQEMALAMLRVGLSNSVNPIEKTLHKQSWKPSSVVTLDFVKLTIILKVLLVAMSILLSQGFEGVGFGGNTSQMALVCGGGMGIRKGKADSVERSSLVDVGRSVLLIIRRQ